MEYMTLLSAGLEILLPMRARGGYGRDGLREGWIGLVPGEELLWMPLRRHGVESRVELLTFNVLLTRIYMH